MNKIYYGSFSDLPIDVVGEQIANKLGLNIVLSDAEDTWEYATYKNDTLSLNITKTEDTHTIKTWMETAPDGINYQMVLFIGALGAYVDDFEAAATAALGNPLTKYYESA